MAGGARLEHPTRRAQAAVLQQAAVAGKGAGHELEPAAALGSRGRGAGVGRLSAGAGGSLWRVCPGQASEAAARHDRPHLHAGSSWSRSMGARVSALALGRPSSLRRRARARGVRCLVRPRTSAPSKADPGWQAHAAGNGQRGSRDVLAGTQPGVHLPVGAAAEQHVHVGGRPARDPAQERIGARHRPGWQPQLLGRHGSLGWAGCAVDRRQDRGGVGVVGRLLLLRLERRRVAADVARAGSKCWGVHGARVAQFNGMCAYASAICYRAPRWGCAMSSGRGSVTRTAAWQPHRQRRSNLKSVHTPPSRG